MVCNVITYLIELNITLQIEHFFRITVNGHSYNMTENTHAVCVKTLIWCKRFVVI